MTSSLLSTATTTRTTTRTTTTSPASASVVKEGTTATAPHRCLLVDLAHVPDHVTSVRLMGRLVGIMETDQHHYHPYHHPYHHPVVLPHGTTTMTTTTTMSMVLLVLDDGSGSTASIVTPFYMWDNLPNKDLGQLMECVATAERHHRPPMTTATMMMNGIHHHHFDASANGSGNSHHHHHHNERQWMAQVLMVVVMEDDKNNNVPCSNHNVETLRMLELSWKKLSESTTTLTTTNMTWGYPSSPVTCDDVLHLIQTGLAGEEEQNIINDNTDDDNGAGAGKTTTSGGTTTTTSSSSVSLEDLSLVLNLPASQVYQMVQELQDQGLVYDINNQQSYVPL